MTYENEPARTNTVTTGHMHNLVPFDGGLLVTKIFCTFTCEKAVVNEIVTKNGMRNQGSRG